MPNSKIYRGDITDKKSIAEKDIDVIVMGEVIEHLENTLQFFRMLKEVHPGKRLICSTPNATNFSNLILGLFRRENTHHDHLSIYSYKTLNTLAQRGGFSTFDLHPYHMKYTEMILRHKGMRKYFVQFAEKSVNMVEHFNPMLAGGYILDAII